ncbi:hypothetical protein JCM10908_003676 [Rhodotorula pacifica]|uniref:uncharacterized protein n=1 Tax=Rhodotorula pacifica TaxID=1495444 RepID=UPI00317B4C91
MANRRPLLPQGALSQQVSASSSHSGPDLLAGLSQNDVATSIWDLLNNMKSVSTLLGLQHAPVAKAWFQALVEVLTSHARWGYRHWAPAEREAFTANIASVDHEIRQAWGQHQNARAAFVLNTMVRYMQPGQPREVIFGRAYIVFRALRSDLQRFLVPVRPPNAPWLSGSPLSSRDPLDYHHPAPFNADHVTSASLNWIAAICQEMGLMNSPIVKTWFGAAWTYLYSSCPGAYGNCSPRRRESFITSISETANLVRQLKPNGAIPIVRTLYSYLCPGEQRETWLFARNQQAGPSETHIPVPVVDGVMWLPQYEALLQQLQHQQAAAAAAAGAPPTSAPTQVSGQQSHPAAALSSVHTVGLPSVHALLGNMQPSDFPPQAVLPPVDWSAHEQVGSSSSPRRRADRHHSRDEAAHEEHTLGAAPLSHRQRKIYSRRGRSGAL